MIRILTICVKLKTLWIRDERVQSRVTSATYIDPSGQHSAASLPGSYSQDQMKQYLTRMWREWNDRAAN